MISQRRKWRVIGNPFCRGSSKFAVNFGVFLHLVYPVGFEDDGDG